MQRIEQLLNGATDPLAPDAQADALRRHHELILEVRALRAMIEPRRDEAERIIAAFEAQSAESQKLKAELDLIHAAIGNTKQEIAALHVTGFKGKEMRRVTDELDAVVAGAAYATEHILGAAEDIREFAAAFRAEAANERERAVARAIVERVVQIFESCNFHDLIGQRIAHVVATLKFIEEHIVKMIDIWGGIEALREFVPRGMELRDVERRRLNGPRLAGDAGHASQDDIDALFG